MDVDAARGVPDRRARARPRHRRRDRAVAPTARSSALRVKTTANLGALSVDLRAGGADVPLRHAAQRRVHHRGDPLRGDRRLQQHHRGRRLSRRRAAGSRLRAGADGGSRRAAALKMDVARGAPEELHPEVLGRVPDARGRVVRQRRLRRRARQAAADARLQEVPRRAGGRAQAGPAARHRVLDVHRGVLDRAVQAGRARSAPAPGSTSRARCASIRPAGSPSTPARTRTGRATRRRSRSWWPIELGIPMEQVEIVHGDTGQIPFGMGTYGSRSGSVGGTAIYMSLNKIKEKGKKIAAHLLEASPGDIEYVDGQFQVKGAPGKAVPFGAVALTAYVPHNYPGGPRARPRGDVVLRSVELLLPLRRPRLRGRDRPGHRQGHDRALRGGGRRRQRHQPDDRGRHGARRRRPGHRAGALGGRDVRRQLGPADDGHA